MMKLPKGARVLDAVLVTDDLGTTGTLDVGWEATADEVADPNGFLNAIDVNSAAAINKMSTTAGYPGMLKQFSAEAQISITASQATTATTGTIELVVYYVVD